MLISLVLPLAQASFQRAPERIGQTDSVVGDVMLFGVFLIVLLLLPLLLRYLAKLAAPVAPRQGRRSENYIVVDGSNVMHWKNETPLIFTVQAVVNELKSRGFTPGVVFDANAGYKLSGRYMNERDFATLLTLPQDQVFVVPKGTPADPWILAAARDFGARIVTRDRYRDWADDHPEVATPGHLVRGGYNTAGELWLEPAKPAEKVPA
ncbi:NYN domain-containing protein [Tabrizicola sp. BL-A-41-H6]|uniref:NYN domain-containing protein n=1 Tax=Tabrizicola sp. BL-A-41-H6 TaxID=3421107 RepID=UPI003D67D339